MLGLICKSKSKNIKGDLLTLFFAMFPLDSPENVRKPKHQKTKGFLMFSGGKKGTMGRKGLNLMESFLNNGFDSMNFNSLFFIVS